MFELTMKFFSLVDSEREEEARALAEAAPQSAERDGLMGYLYYFGIGGKMQSIKMAYVMFERGIREYDSLSLYMLGLMCDREETPDQTTDGPRKKYDRADAPRLMERCVKDEMTMSLAARLWLGEYYLDGDRGANPDLGIKHLEFAAENYICEDALTVLVDYYREISEDSSLPTNIRTRSAFNGAKWQQKLDSLTEKMENPSGELLS